MRLLYIGSTECGNEKYLRYTKGLFKRTPGKMDEIKRIANAHGALIIEDAAESLGSRYKLNGEWAETGTLGDYNCISFNGNNVFEMDSDAVLCNKYARKAA